MTIIAVVIVVSAALFAVLLRRLARLEARSSGYDPLTGGCLFCELERRHLTSEGGAVER